MKISFVPGDPQNLKNHSNSATVVRNQGSHKFGLHWIRDAPGVDFGEILGAGGIISVPLGSHFVILEGPRDRVEI